MSIGIYLITNKINGKRYIGQSVNIEKRFSQHKSKSTKKYYVDKAINKYGVAAFTFTILMECSVDRLDYYEIAAIAEYGSFSDEGYNLTEGGSTRRGYVYSDEAKAKMKAAALLRWSAPANRRKHEDLLGPIMRESGMSDRIRAGMERARK